MKIAIKRLLTLALAVVMLALSLSLVSCSEEESTIEDFLSADNYTYKQDENKFIMVDGSTVYCKNEVNEQYLYLSEAEECYYYCALVKGTIISKLKIDSEDYIIYHNQMVSGASSFAAELTAFLQIMDELERDGEAYKYQTHSDGTYTAKITIKEEQIIREATIQGVKYVSKVCDMDNTVITIPNAVKQATSVTK